MTLRLGILVSLLVLAGCVATPAPAPTVPTPEPLATDTAAMAELTPTATPDTEPSPTKDGGPHRMIGDLSNQILRLETTMPGKGSEGFAVPTASEQATFAKLIAKVKAGKVTDAMPIAKQSGYELLDYVDRGDGNAAVYLLREKKPIRKGWGLYVVRRQPTNNIIVEAPHPLFDEGTPTLALDIFRALDAEALLVAGAHRNANSDGLADVSHHGRSMFEVVHEAYTRKRSATVLQIHAFSSTKHPDYPHVVIGSDGSKRTDLIDRLVAALESRGIRAEACNAARWEDLCGQTNYQSDQMNGGIFVHIEVDESIRNDRSNLIAAFAEILTPPAVSK